MKRIAAAVVPLSLLSLLTGCGGSGTATEANNLPTGGARAESAPTAGKPTAPPSAPTSAAAPFFPVALSLGSTLPGQTHLWVTLHKLEGIGTDEKAVTLFESGEGMLLDLAAGEAVLPGAGATSATLPPLTRLRLVLAPALQRVRAGETLAETVALVPGLPKDDEGRAVLSLTLPKPFEGKRPLSLALDPSKFTIVDGKANLALLSSESAGKPAPQTFAAVIREAQGETLTLIPGGSSGRVTVQLTPATVVVQGDGSASPKVGAGAAVLVTATPDTAGKHWIAQRVVVGALEAARAAGEVSELDPKTASFTLTATQLQGVLPTRTAMTVSLDEKAVLRGRSGLALGRDTFLAALAEKGARVLVEGSYEPATGTLVARRASLLGESVHEVKVTGTGVADEKAGTLSVTTLTEWDGFLATEKGVTLRLTAATTFASEKGEPISREALVAALKERRLSAVGLLDAEGTLTATRLQLGAELPKPAPEKSEKDADKAEKKPDETKG